MRTLNYDTRALAEGKIDAALSGLGYIYDWITK